MAATIITCRRRLEMAKQHKTFIHAKENYLFFLLKILRSFDKLNNYRMKVILKIVLPNCIYKLVPG